MFHCGTTMFVFLPVAVFLLLPDDAVNGEETRITQVWIHNTRWPILDETLPALRQGEDGDGYELTRRTVNPNKEQAGRFSTKLKTRRIPRRTTPYFESAIDPCDYLALSCLRAYQTGRVCGRSTYVTYFTFKNFCMMDYTNCKSRYKLWQAIHMGDCLVMGILTETAIPVSDETSRMMQGIYIAEPDF